MKRIELENGFKRMNRNEGWRYGYLLPNIVIVDHYYNKRIVLRFQWLYFHVDILLRK